MTQYARPNSPDISAGGWSPSSGSTLWEMLDESSPNDSDYVTATIGASGSDQFTVSLSNPDAPGIYTGHILRVRLWQPSDISLGDSTYTISVYETTTLIGEDSGTVATSSPSTESYTLLTTEADDITDYDDLRIRVNIDNDQIASAPYRVSWAELEVPDVVLTTPWAQIPSVGWRQGDACRALIPSIGWRTANKVFVRGGGQWEQQN